MDIFRFLLLLMQNTAPKLMELNWPNILKSCGWFPAASRNSCKPNFYILNTKYSKPKPYLSHLHPDHPHCILYFHCSRNGFVLLCLEPLKLNGVFRECLESVLRLQTHLHNGYFNPNFKLFNC